MTEQILTREQIVETLKSGIVNFKYTKKDGTERIASGTLNMEFIKSQGAEPNGNGVERQGIISYYDLGKEAWRCFNEDNFIEFIK